jgi:hypothetical protein
VLRFDRPEIKAAATPQLLRRGVVHVIGLEPLRDQAGSGWDTLQTNVHARLETMLRRSLGPSDFFAGLNDVAYLVTMPAADARDAETACLRLTYDLYASYLGHCDLHGLKLYRAAEGGAGAIRLDLLPHERLEQAAARAGISDAVHAPRGSRTPMSLPPVSLPPLAAAEAKFGFLPVWDARNEAITSYACVLVHDPERREPMKRDLLCLKVGVDTLMRHLDRGERFLMTLRIGFDTLASPVARMDFAALCRNLPAEFRPYILFELTGLPEGVPRTRLFDLVTALRPYAQGIKVQIPVQCRNYAPFSGLPLHGLGLDLARYKGAVGPSEVARLCTEAKRLSLPAFLDGVADVAALKAARAGGVQSLSGPAIAPLLSAPRPITRLSWREVAERAAQKGAA